MKTPKFVQFCNQCDEKPKERWKNIYEMKMKDTWKDEKGKIYVYIISWRIGEKAHPIGRLGGMDTHGILYIGCQTNSTRIKNFWTSATSKTKGGHSAGNLYQELKLKEKVKLTQLYFASKLCDETNAEKTEERWIRKYSEWYLEAPPLNRAMPKKVKSKKKK